VGHFGRFSEKNSNTLGLGCYYLVGRIYIVEPILHLKMGIDQYFAAKDQVERISATIDQAIAKMAYTLSAHTNSDGLADHRKLKGEASRRELADKIEGILFEYAKDLTKSTLNPSNPEDFMRLSSSTYGLFGFSKEDVLKYLDQDEDHASSFAFFQYMTQRTVYGYMRSKRAGLPKLQLSEADIGPAVQNMKIEDRVHINRLKIDDLAELLDEWRAKEAIGRDFLRGKDYAVKNPQGLIVPEGNRIIVPVRGTPRGNGGH